MAAVRGRVDQPAATVAVDDAVAGPQVAVQPGRWLGGPPTRSRSPARRSSCRIDAAGRAARVGGESGERQQPAFGVELDPRGARVVRQRPAAGGPAVLPSERRRAGAVQRRQAGAELAVGRSRRAPSSIHSSRRNAGVPSPTAITSGTDTASASRSQRRPAASVEKKCGGGERMRLAEDRPAVVGVDPVGDRHVAPVDSGRRPDRSRRAPARTRRATVRRGRPRRQPTISTRPPEAEAPQMHCGRGRPPTDDWLSAPGYWISRFVFLRDDGCDLPRRVPRRPQPVPGR